MQDSESWREKVARIIDPGKWRVLDSYLADVKRKYRGENAGYDPDAFKDKASLAKADAIAALSPATEGWRVVPVEPTEAMAIAARDGFWIALTGCATANGLAHGWAAWEAHCYPSGTVDCDGYPTKACSCN